MEDDELIQKAFAVHRVLITNDKDFGEKVYRERCPHRGVILLRLADERSTAKIEALQKLLATYSDPYLRSVRCGNGDEGALCWKAPFAGVKTKLFRREGHWYRAAEVYG